MDVFHLKLSQMKKKKKSIWYFLILGEKYDPHNIKYGFTYKKQTWFVLITLWCVWWITGYWEHEPIAIQLSFRNMQTVNNTSTAV